MGSEPEGDLVRELDLALLDRILHDVRQPLAVIQSFADLLEAGVSGSLNPAQLEYVDLISRSVEQMDRELTHARLLAAVFLEEMAVERETRPESFARVRLRFAQTLERRGIHVELGDEITSAQEAPGEG